MKFFNTAVVPGGGVTIVECLCHLDQLAGPQAFFVALPLRIAGGDGSPRRSLAIEGIPAYGWMAGGAA